MVALAAVSGAVAARHRAVTAADMAALAGAQALIDGLESDQACASAGSVAAAMGAELTGCVPLGGDNLRASCSATVHLGALGPHLARATAVAGPP
jgi:secretion/DNA translocation related TadE-like protein